MGLPGGPKPPLHGLRLIHRHRRHPPPPPPPTRSGWAARLPTCRRSGPLDHFRLRRHVDHRLSHVLRRCRPLPRQPIVSIQDGLPVGGFALSLHDPSHGRRARCLALPRRTRRRFIPSALDRGGRWRPHDRLRLKPCRFLPCSSGSKAPISAPPSAKAPFRTPSSVDSTCSDRK